MAEKLVEIDEAELLRLRRTQETLGLALKNPKARKLLSGAVKEILPNDPLAKEADQVDPVEQRFSELSKANADLKKQIEDDKADRERNAKLSVLQADQERGFDDLKKAKWTDDGIAKVKKVMEDKGILDVAIAAKWVESQMPPQNPITPSGTGSWNFMDQPKDGGDEFIKKMIESKGGNENAVTMAARDAIAEIRGQR